MATDDAPATPPVTVVPLDVERAADAGTALARAFQNDPIQSAIIPNDDRRAEVLGTIFTALVRGTVASGGRLLTTPDHGAVALWHPPGVRLSPLAMVRAYGFDMFRVITHTPVSSYRGMAHLFGTLGRQREVHMPDPHWYLAVLGVDPAHQGGGVGSALVRAGLARSDAARLPAYVETETEGNVTFYERLGFQVLERVVIDRLDLPMWLMARDPA